MALFWTCHELGLEQLLALSFEEATARYRSNGPAILLSRLGSGAADDYCIANLLSPAGTVFWAAPVRQALMAHRLPADAALRAKVKTQLKPFLPARGPASKKAGRTEWLRTFLEDLGEDRGPARTLSAQPPSFKEQFRRLSCVLRNDAVAAFVQGQNSELGELGDFAFFGADERVLMLDSTEPASLRAAFFSGISPVAFIKQPDAWDALNQRLLAGMVAEIRALEAGAAYSFQIEPLRVVNPVLNFHLPPVAALRQRSEACLVQALACRARLVRLLGWPSHLASVLAALPVEDTGLPTLRDYQATAPYDAVAELQAYLSDMAMRFPSLLDSLRKH